MKISGIYQIKNKISGMVYVGSSKNLTHRLSEHKKILSKDKHHNKKLQNDWNSYDDSAFLFEILEIVDDLSKLFVIEKDWIEKIGAYTYGYNSTIGNNPTFKSSNEWQLIKPKNKPGGGGTREGAGAKPKGLSPRRMLSIRLPDALINSIPGSKTEFIEMAIVAALENKMKHFNFIDYDTKGCGVFAEYSDDEYSKVKTECRFDLKSAKRITKLANERANEISTDYLSNETLSEILTQSIIDAENR